SVRPPCDVPGQDDPGVVLQGGQGSVADDRLGPRRRGGPARPDVLLYADRLECAGDPDPLRLALEGGSHALQRQAESGPGGPGQPDGPGGPADGAFGPGPLRVDRDLVPPRRSSVVVLPRSPVVSGQGRAVVCGHPRGPASGELAESIPGCGLGADW